MNAYTAYITQAIGSERMGNRRWQPVTDEAQAGRILRRFAFRPVASPADRPSLGVYTAETLHDDDDEICDLISRKEACYGSDGFSINLVDVR